MNKQTAIGLFVKLQIMKNKPKLIWHSAIKIMENGNRIDVTKSNIVNGKLNLSYKNKI